MNAPQKHATRPINLGIMRLELLMRAHEISRRIDERVRRALHQAKTTTVTPEMAVLSTNRATTGNGSQP
ncbi:MAG: hypothetical protein JNM56_12025 [Planctomycetia bacterium]|nr:hypothetical protein [Planctomycetia bacterium]